jgi:hypothetical protein
MKLFLAVLFLATAACTSHPCKIEDRAAAGDASIKEKGSTVKKDLTSRVFVYKADGSLQCGQGAKIELSVMQKELGGMQVFSSENKHDGMMRIQVCGAPTGNVNVYEIDVKDLEAATKAGFKKWLK